MKNLLNNILPTIIILFLALTIGLGSPPSCSTTFKVFGVVSDDKGSPIEIGNVLALSLVDSSLIKGDLFFDGKFELTDIEESNFILVLTAVGYLETRVNVSIKNGDSFLDIGKVELTSIQLGEVVVTAQYLPVFRQEKGKMVIDVSNNVFTEGSDAIDILKKAPRILVNNESISVFGKGTAIILVDGKRVASNDILSTLPASEILKIEVISNPSAKYDAEGNAVVNIITKKNNLEGINAKIRLSATKAAFMRYNYGAEISYKKDKWNLYAQYSNKPAKKLVEENYHRFFTGGDDLIELKQSINKISNFKDAHRGKIALDYTLNDKHAFGAQFSGAWYDGKMETINENNLFNDGEFQFALKSLKYADYERNRNTGNFNYTFLPDTSGTRLFVSLDHTEFKSRAYDEIIETIDGRDDEFKYSDNFNRIKISIGQLDFTKPLERFDGQIEVGAKVIRSSSVDDIQFSRRTSLGELELDLNNSNGYKYDEEIVAAYFTLSKKVGKVDIAAGLRLENTSSKGFSAGEVIIDSSYINLFPNASLAYSISKNLNIELSYAKRIGRPTLQDMDPFVFYIDSFSVIKGNPYLVPKISNSFEASITYMQYASINIGYTTYKNAIFPVVSQEENSPISILSQQNIPSYKKVFISLNIPYQTKKWTTFNSIGVQKKIIDINLEGIDLNFTKPMWYVYAYNKFTLPAKIKLETTFMYYSAGIEGVFNFNSAYRFSFGVNKSFLDDKLNLTLNFNDVFKTDRQAGSTNLPSINVLYNSYYDSAYVRLSAVYKFGKIIKSKNKWNNKKELKRIKTQ